MDGIRNILEPPASVDQNIFEMTEKQRMELGIEKLPGTMGEAIEEFEKDEFVKQVLGRHITEKYLEQKRAEWAEYQTQVTDWEVKRYLMRF